MFSIGEASLLSLSVCLSLSVSPSLSLSLSLSHGLTLDLSTFLSARRNGFVHLDVKPENILRKNDHFKLAGFGLTIRRDAGASQEDLEHIDPRSHPREPLFLSLTLSVDISPRSCIPIKRLLIFQSVIFYLLA
jgi:serine/threonine protein kinase